MGNGEGSFGKPGILVDCFTVIMHGPNAGNLGACCKGCAKGLSVAFEKKGGIPTGHMSPQCIAAYSTMHCFLVIPLFMI